MSRWLCAALAWLMLLQPLAASARVVIIAPKQPSVTISVDEGNDRVQGDKTALMAAAAIMRQFGVEYDVVPASLARTEFCRTGVFTYNYGTASAYTVSYDAVIHAMPRRHGNFQAAGSAFSYRPDSLSLKSVGPLLVPQLFLSTDGDNDVVSGRDSIGGGTAQSNATTMGITQYLTTDPTLRYRATKDENEFVVGRKAAGDTTLGYMRVLIGSRYNTTVKNTGTGGGTEMRVNCNDCDSLISAIGAPAGNLVDTAQVWVVKHHDYGGTFATTSKPIVVAAAAHYYGLEADWVALMAGFAFLDSASGGRVFSSSKLPLKVGIQVRGGWRRNAGHISGGMLNSDSANFKASIDSIASLRVPFVVGVNMDSIRDYTDDRNWWERAAPYVHYSPENWGGVTTQALSISTRGTTSWQRPLDALGMVRTRAAYGDSTGVGADTSIHTLVRANFWRLDSMFRGRVDHALIAPNFDWVGAGILSATSSKADSLISALSDAGVKAVVTNSKWRMSYPWYQPSNPFSLSGEGRPLPIKYGRSAGSRLTHLTTPGFADSGCARYELNNHGATENAFQSLRTLEGFWRGALTGRVGAYQAIGDFTTGIDSTSMRETYPRIYTIHAGDLGSGPRADAAERPARTGWWQIKYLVNGARIINRIAGRTIVSIEYPENVTQP